MNTPTVMLTPWHRRGQSRTGGTSEQPGSSSPTGILDCDSPEIRDLVARAGSLAGSLEPFDVLRAAHSLITAEVRAVYALEEVTPSSRTLARGFGSCSQRLAILESAARAIGIETRVRALLIDRSFWAPRFSRMMFAVPPRVVIAWPEFLGDGWKPVSELFGPVGCGVGGAFTNSGSETLFEAVGRCAVDWDGFSGGGPSDLSGFVREDLGYFTDRDELFGWVGQTLCAPVRALVDPAMRRVSA